MADLAAIEYHQPRSVAAALTALARPGARALAGGTDLIPALLEGHDWAAEVRCLVDLKALASARGIARRGHRLWLGALVTADQIARSALVVRLAPALAEAAAATGSPGVRVQGTLGGNLVTPHPAGDVATALVALDAMVTVVDGRGRRRASMRSVLAGRRRPRGWLLLGVEVPIAPRSGFAKLSSRRGFGRALGAAAVVLDARDGARIAVSGVEGVGPRPGLLRRATRAGWDEATRSLIDVLVARARARAEAR